MLYIVCLTTALILVPSLAAPPPINNTKSIVQEEVHARNDVLFLCPKHELFGTSCLPTESQKNTTTDALCFVILDYAIQGCNISAPFTKENVTCPMTCPPLKKFKPISINAVSVLSNSDKCLDECRRKPELCQQVSSLIALLKKHPSLSPSTETTNGLVTPAKLPPSKIENTGISTPEKVVPAISTPAKNVPAISQGNNEAPVTSKEVPLTNPLISSDVPNKNHEGLTVSVNEDVKSPDSQPPKPSNALDGESIQTNPQKEDKSKEVLKEESDAPALPDKGNDDDVDYEQTDGDVPPLPREDGPDPDGEGPVNEDMEKTDENDERINHQPLLPLSETRKEVTFEENELVMGVRTNGPYRDTPDSHFFFYFLSFVSISGIAYIAFHNKNKILALLLEGRRGRNQNRRRPNSAGYRKLDTSLEEAMMSHPSRGPATHVIY